MNPKDVLRATDPHWRREAREIIERGEEVVVINLAPQDFDYAIALGQEFDYCCLVLDKGEDLERFKAMFDWNEEPVAPKSICLIHRSKVRHQPI